MQGTRSMWSSNNFSVRIIPEPCKPPVESSPRMQGALPSTENHSKHYRIIPADAGSTLHSNTRSATGQDHPRGCGEHARSAHPMRVIAGSSPRMRGARDRPGVQVPDHRIIPADAGSTQGEDGKESRERDHPRGCGEHVGRMRELAMNEGSSPRMRGAPFEETENDTSLRIIPADAGSTSPTAILPPLP